MPLHLTKIAYGAKSFADMQDWFDAGKGGELRLVTRCLPRRHEEMRGGSLYWILDHALVARSPLAGFAPREDGRWSIILERRLIPVEPRACRAHQGWRYLANADAPPDLDTGATKGEALPGSLAKELARLGLI